PARRAPAGLARAGEPTVVSPATAKGVSHRAVGAAVHRPSRIAPPVAQPGRTAGSAHIHVGRAGLQAHAAADAVRRRAPLAASGRPTGWRASRRAIIASGARALPSGESTPGVPAPPMSAERLRDRHRAAGAWPWLLSGVLLALAAAAAATRAL